MKKASSTQPTQRKKANAVGVTKRKTVSPRRKPSVKTKTKAAIEAPKKPVLVLRTCNADGTSHKGFRWPLEVGAVVEAPDWRDDTNCGGGLHGWLWGSGDWGLKSKDANRVWMVLEVDERDVRDLDGKVKFPRCTVAHLSSDWASAMAYIRGAAAYIERFAAADRATGDFGHASATGDSGHASATGYSGHASATGTSGHASATGDFGHASATGYSGHASATGDSGHASATGTSGHASATGTSGHASATGYSGHASATGYSGHASATGYSGCAVAIGVESRVRCGIDGFIAAAWRDAADRRRLLVGYVGEDGIKAGQWYRVEVTGGTAKFIEVAE